MSNKASIYPEGNPPIIKLFEQAGHPAKVLCVALDYAKAQHTALICNGLGDLVRGAFAVDNTPVGAKALLEEVRHCAKPKKVPAEQIFFGGEDYPSFAENFLRHLRRAGFLVVRVNAWEAKQQRSNFQASTDALDLLGIARCCLNRRGQPVVDLPVAYANLRIATRNRDQLVRSATATSNRIHTYVDRLFPGFLSQARSGLAPFCEASLDLMGEGFSPAEIRRRPQGPLGQWLARRGVSEPRAVRRMCSYAGVVSKTKQTGGPEKEPVAGHVQHRCNKRLKNVVLQAVEKVRQFGPEDLRRAAQDLEAQGSHTEFGMAKRLVRLAKYLVVTGTIYRPKALMAADTDKGALGLYYQQAWDKLLQKWKGKADLKDVFAPGHPLGQWRKMAQELYALELRLPAQRAARATSASAP